MRYRLAFAASFVAVLTLLGACGAKAAVPPAAVPRPTLSLVTVHRTATQLWVLGFFTISGGATFGVDSAGLNSGNTAATLQGHNNLPVTTKVDSFPFPLPAPGATTAGYFGVKACNAASCSGMSFRSWSYTAPALPPTVTVDSVVAKPVSFTTTAPTGQRVTYAAMGTMIPGTPTQGRLFCAFGFLSDGSVHRGAIGGTVTDAAVRAASCDSLGRALYSVRYSLQRIRLLPSPFVVASR